MHPAQPFVVAYEGPAEGPASDWSDLAEPMGDRLFRLATCRDCYGDYYKSGGEFKQRTVHEPVTRELCVRHAKGEITIGLFPISADNRCLWAAGDIDFHDKPDEDATRNRDCAEAAAKFPGRHGFWGGVKPADTARENGHDPQRRGKGGGSWPRR